MITLRIRFSCLIGIVTFSLLSSNAFGELITIYGTGLNANGTQILQDGTADPHYFVTSSPYGPFNPVATEKASSWVPSATAKWISVTGTAKGASHRTGDYFHQTTFDLTNFDLDTVRIAGKWASDNSSSIYLNGTNTGYSRTQAGFGSLAVFSLTSGFTPGVNTLQFRVNNAAGATNPTGLLVEITSATGTVVPEPSSIMLILCGGLAGLCWWRRRK